MSKREYKRVGVGELDYAAPLVFEEAKPMPGKGGKAFKSLTAAVKAAEREKEEARGYKVAAEVLLKECEGRLRAMECYVRCVRRWLWIDFLWSTAVVLTGVLFMIFFC